MKLQIKKRNLLGLFVSALLLFFIFYKIDFRQLFVTIKMLDYKVIFYVVPIYLLCQLVRGVRWNYLLCNDKKYSPIISGAVFSAGTALNAFLPARAGDIWRAYYMGKRYDESKMKIFGSVILERIFDGISVVLILIAAILLYSKQDWILSIAYLSAAVFIGGFVVFYLIYRFHKVNTVCDFFINIAAKLPETIAEKTTKLLIFIKNYLNLFMQGFECLNSFKYMFFVLLTSVFIWYLEGYVTLLLLKAFGMGLGFSASLFVISFIALSAMIPSTSVFVGPYQYAYILALGIYHIPKSSALAIAFVHQAVIIIIVCVISIIFFAKTNLKLASIRSEIDKND